MVTRLNKALFFYYSDDSSSYMCNFARTIITAARPEKISLHTLHRVYWKSVEENVISYKIFCIKIKVTNPFSFR